MRPVARLLGWALAVSEAEAEAAIAYAVGRLRVGLVLVAVIFAGVALAFWLSTRGPVTPTPTEPSSLIPNRSL